MHAQKSLSRAVASPDGPETTDPKSISQHFFQLADLTDLATGDTVAADRLRDAAMQLQLLLQQPSPHVDFTTGLPQLPLDQDLRALVGEFWRSGNTQVSQTMASEIPDGVLELLQLPHLGAVRLRTVWKEMNIHGLSGLEHAISENRLLHQKGFGPKTQEKLRKSVIAAQLNGNRFRISDLRPIADRLIQELGQLLGPNMQCSLTGELRRGLPMCKGIEILASPQAYKPILLHIIRTSDYEILTAGAAMLLGRLRGTHVPFIFNFQSVNFFLELFRTTGSQTHVETIPVDVHRHYRSEAEIYREAGLPFLPPEAREGKDEIKLALSHRLPHLVGLQDIRGLLHAHSTYSDGRDTLAAMAAGARALGMQYLGISDHGPGHAGAAMHLEAGRAQRREITQLNRQMAPFKLLQGIEAEISHDGGLHLPDSEIANFDFVIAALHLPTALSRTEATLRLIKAIRNPFTTIIAHPTGKLMEGPTHQPIDMSAIIEACSENDVAIELNGHPCRRDLDWQWIRAAAAKGIKIAINPNAHSISALTDYENSVALARKGLVSPEQTLNAMSIAQIEGWLAHRRNLRTN